MSVREEFCCSVLILEGISVCVCVCLGVCVCVCVVTNRSITLRFSSAATV